MRIGERLGLGEEERSALFYALLSKDTGCSSNASRVANLSGADDFAVKKNYKVVNWSRLSEDCEFHCLQREPRRRPVVEAEALRLRREEGAARDEAIYQGLV
jgi:hypothetical protein